MNYKTLVPAVAIVLAGGISLFAQQSAPSQSWPDSPEAVFLTTEERAEWFTLDTDAEREAFKNRYWLQRDPTPDNGRLEFKEVVEKRIENADKRFRIEKTPGSQTARGMVFILLGSPASAKDEQFSQNAPGAPTDSLVGMHEGNEFEVTWKYDLLRTPSVLKAIGRPNLEIVFVIEPSRRRDSLQKPGLFDTIRENLSRASIINPIPLSTVRKPDTAVEPLPGPALPADIAAQLEEVSTTVTSPLRSVTTWTADGSPLTTVWFVASEPAPGLAPKLAGRIRDGEGKNVVSVLRDVRPSTGYSTHGHDAVLSTRLRLQPGTYEAAFVAQQAGITKPLGTAAGRIVVPTRSAEELAVSSLVLTDAVNAAGASAFSIGSLAIRPRADHSFATNESLWYTFQIASASKPEGAKFAVVLRKRDGSSVQAAALPADITPAGEGLYAAAYEMPLATLAPGDYSLYLTVTDREGREQVRRGDFKVTAVPVQ